MAYAQWLRDECFPLPLTDALSHIQASEVWYIFPRYECCLFDLPFCTTENGYVCFWKLDGTLFFEKSLQIPGQDPAMTAVMRWNRLLSEKQTLPAFSVPSAWQKSGHSRFFPLFHSLPYAWQVPGYRSAGSIPASGGWSFSVLCSGRSWIWSLFALSHLILLSLRCFLVFNILFYCFQRSTAHRRYKIAVCPESRHFRFKIGKFLS